MKSFLTTIASFLFPFLLFSQATDSIAIRQVDSLIQVSRDLTTKQDFGQALEANEAAEKIALEKLGRESAAYGSCCFNRGRVMYIKGDYSDAEKWYLESKDIRGKVLGKEHSDYANNLKALATLSKKKGHYGEAELLYLEALAILKKVLGKEHPDYARCLNDLALLYWRIGNYEKAELLNYEVLGLYDKTLGKENSDYAGSLNNLAALHMDMGQYEKSELFFLEALDLYEIALGKEHSFYAESLNNLSVLYVYMGQYEKAEMPCLNAKNIWEKVLGKDHPNYAASVSNQAMLYCKMSQYEKANTLFLESKAILEKALGKEHPSYSTILNNLAVLYIEMTQYEKVEQLYLEAKNIQEKTLGKEHPDYARTLCNLAGLYNNMTQYEKAEQLHLEAKNIQEKTLGKEHPDYAHSMKKLGIVYYNKGQYEKAESFFLESKIILEKALGKEHPDYAQSLINLAILYQDVGKSEKAEPLFLELFTVNKLLIEKAMYHLSERELNNYLNTFSQSQDQTLSFTQIVNSKKLIPVCYDNSLFYKGFLLQAASRVKQLALSDSTSTEKYYQLKGYQRRLGAQYAQPIAERDSALVAHLETQSNDLEKDLARTVAGWGEAMQQVTWQEVQATLQPGEAAVEFVHYRYYDKKETDSTMYAALVLLSGSPAPSFIPLFEEKQLDSLLQTQGERKADYVNTLYTVAERGARPIGKPQRTLYELLWQPLEKELATSKTIYFSPSGLLHRLNLSAIPISGEENLGDRYRLQRLNSTRQLVIPTEVGTSAEDAVLYGGVEYEMDSTAIAMANQGYDAGLMATRGELSFSYADSTNRGGTWQYLTWTDQEVDKIEMALTAAGFQTHTRKSYAATEGSFKAIGHGKPSPRILHLATHGFFFPDPKTENRNPISEIGQSEPVFKMSDHPMIRSGLILAGGNQAWQTRKPFNPNMEDGILTAYEISQMNLSNTELVVLSACETGLGDIKGNEGVYGLQRAFKIAGAKYLIMSLWQVPDKETAYFMELFYRHLTEGELSVPEAFRATQKELRENPFVTPYQWAGFVLME